MRQSSIREVMKLIVGLLLLLIVEAAPCQAPSPVPHLDMKQYVGQWYEVARYSDKSEKHCVGDAIVLYALGDKPGRFEVVTSCRMKDGVRDIHNKDGKAQDTSGGGALKLASLWPFWTKYWVLALDPGYQWALVGTPNHKNLWILSKTETLSPETLTDIEAKASAQGFNVAKMSIPPQTNIVGAKSVK